MPATTAKPTKRCGNPLCRKWHDQSRSRSYCPDCERARVRKALRKHRRKQKERVEAERVKQQREAERKRQLELLNELGAAQSAHKLLTTIYRHHAPEEFAEELARIMQKGSPGLRLRATQLVLRIIQAAPEA